MARWWQGDPPPSWVTFAIGFGEENPGCGYCNYSSVIWSRTGEEGSWRAGDEGGRRRRRKKWRDVLLKSNGDPHLAHKLYLMNIDNRDKVSISYNTNHGIHPKHWYKFHIFTRKSRVLTEKTVVSFPTPNASRIPVNANLFCWETIGGHVRQTKHSLHSWQRPCLQGGQHSNFEDSMARLPTPGCGWSHSQNSG